MLNYFLYPENMIVSKEPTEIITILGSCISVCLYDTKLRFGGINHYLLPVCNSKSVAKCGNRAIPTLIEKMIANGSKKFNLVAKIVGGANIIAGKDFFSIGQKNIRIAKTILQKENITVIESHIGGKFGRKLIFNSYDGEIKVITLKT